jgi:hypothetical protein
MQEPSALYELVLRHFDTINSSQSYTSIKLGIIAPIITKLLGDADHQE